MRKSEIAFFFLVLGPLGGCSTKVSEGPCEGRSPLKALEERSRKELQLQDRKTLHRYSDPEALSSIGDLMAYRQCESLRDSDEAACGKLSDFRDPRGDDAEVSCRFASRRLRFVFLALKDGPENEKRIACRSFLEDLGSEEEGGLVSKICEELIRGYRAGFSPLCTRIQLSGALSNPVLYDEFGSWCRTRLYVPNDRSCLEIHEPLAKRTCLEFAGDVSAFRERSPEKCVSPGCRALSGDENACENFLSDVQGRQCPG